MVLSRCSSLFAFELYYSISRSNASGPSGTRNLLHRGLGTYYESLSVVELLLEYHHHHLIRRVMLIINWFYKLVYKVASLDTQCIDSNLESGRYISRVRSARGFLSLYCGSTTSKSMSQRYVK